MRNVVFAKYNALRRPEYQITTTIYEENGKRFVVKEPKTEKAWEHIEALERNCVSFSNAHKNLGVAVPEIKDHAAVYDYITGHNMEEELQEMFDDAECVIVKIMEKLSYIYDYEAEYLTEFVCSKIFEEMFLDDMNKVDREKLCTFFSDKEAVNVADVDLVFDNIICKNGQWILLDYEWVLEVPVPIDFLKFRTAAYFYDRHNLYFSGKYSRTRYFEMLGYENETVRLFDLMEANFQNRVRGNYQYLKSYRKKIIPFREYETHTAELEQRDESIQFLNEVISSKEEYIVSMEKLIEKYHDNPAYKIINSIRKVYRNLRK